MVQTWPLAGLVARTDIGYAPDPVSHVTLQRPQKGMCPCFSEGPRTPLPPKRGFQFSCTIGPPELAALPRLCALQIDVNDSAAAATAKALKKRSSNNINYAVLEDLLEDAEDKLDEEFGAGFGAEAVGADEPEEVDYGDEMELKDELEDLVGKGL